MLKLFFIFSAIAMMFTSQVCSMPEKLNEEIMFSAYNNGHQIEMTEDDIKKFDEIFSEMLQDCRPMPALGVSLHDQTMKEVENGIWIRFEFDETIEVNELPFDELLIKIAKDMYGFNVIRGNQGKFEGRCFYVDIPRNLDKLYDYLLELPVSQEEFAFREFSTQTSTESEDCKESSFETQDLKIKEVSLSQSLPSINKDNKDKSNTVIEQTGFQDRISNTIVKAIEF